ncbi:hypothetical protein [Dyella tabacisoli]|uniref:Uncharacterized protein n=1 Tax=Dyella tabacisoli TaxID=2282381 RepID=A0A369UGC5_9GAMM|nr:hypothetical protein [Dyella tabacisoli]RDD79782.1 hypothetical protein DVJ77_20615 [Dyella tabacisoli]
MYFHKNGVALAATLGCLLMVGCATDTPKSVHQNKEEYLGRSFAPTHLSRSLLEAAAQSAEKPLPFNKLIIKQATTVKYPTGMTTEWSSDTVYRNAGNGLVEGVITYYSNGIETQTLFELTYRGIYPLIWQIIPSNNVKMPFVGQVKSISQIDRSFDKPSLNFVYRTSWNAPRAMDGDGSRSCTSTGVYPASKLNSKMQGEAREYDCNVTNDNGIASALQKYVYLDAYGVAFVKSMKKTDLNLNWRFVDFKVE